MIGNGSMALLVTPIEEHATTGDLLDLVMDKIQIVLYMLTIILGVMGNSVVIWAAGFHLPANVTNVWLVNLALADFIFCLTRVFSLVKKLFFEYWPFGTFVCKFSSFFKYTNMFCSVFLLSVISVDRALCVWRPVWAKQHRTLTTARLVSAGVWFLAISLSSPYFVFRNMYTGNNNLTKCTLEDKEKGQEDSTKVALYVLRFLCGFLLPFLVILCCYTLAAVGIRRTKLRRRAKPLKILAALVCAFFLCWAPYHCLLLAKMVGGKSTAVKIGLPVAKGVACFNSCVNPLLYFCMGLDCRKGFRQSLSVVYRRALEDEGEGPTPQERSTSPTNIGTQADRSECQAGVI